MRRESTIKTREFSHDYATRLLKRVEARLRRSARNRSRPAYERGYVEAADAIRRIIR